MAEISPFFDQVGPVQTPFFSSHQLSPMRFIPQMICQLHRFNLSHKTNFRSHPLENDDVITKKIRKNHEFSGQKMTSRFFKSFFLDLRWMFYKLLEDFY